MKLKLRIEPVPVSTWGKSLANRLPKREWDGIRSHEYRRADYKCEVCDNVNETLHCHEKWKFDDKQKIQRFAGFEVCCESCHNVHHFGRSKETYNKDYIEKLIRHWCKVNKKRRGDFQAHEQEVFEMNRKRANKYYVVKVGRKILT